MKMRARIIGALACIILTLTSCSYNPLSSNNHTTGSAIGAISGAGIAGGSVAALGGSKPLIAAAALVGGAIGYYVTTQRFDAGGIMRGGGQVYSVGQYVGIYIPSDALFEPNSVELLPEAKPILESVADIIDRYPNHNILISGNTSGFGRARCEQILSQGRAERIAAYLWYLGVNEWRCKSLSLRRLNYVGYGDYFPISSNHYNCGIRSNSRIQITIYPSYADLHLDQRHVAMHNISSIVDDESMPVKDPCNNRVY